MGGHGAAGCFESHGTARVRRRLAAGPSISLDGGDAHGRHGYAVHIEKNGAVRDALAGLTGIGDQICCQCYSLRQKDSAAIGPLQL